MFTRKLLMDYPFWLLPSAPAELLAVGVARDPHIIYDEPDEVELARLKRMREKRDKEKASCLQISD